MSLPLIIIVLLILGSAVAAMTRHNLIHSALLLVLTWAGIAGFYLWAGAEFIAFAQLLVYGGAISMVVLFAVLLTRQNLNDVIIVPDSRRRAVGAVMVGALMMAVLGTAVWHAHILSGPTQAPNLSVRELGQLLMEAHAASLLVVGVLLTVALLGATILASGGKSTTQTAGPDLGPADEKPTGTHQGAAPPPRADVQSEDAS